MIFKIKSSETQSNEWIYFSILPPNFVLCEDRRVSVLCEFQVCSLSLSLALFFNPVQYAACVCWIIKANTPTNKAMSIDGWFLSCLHYPFRILAKGSRYTEKYLKTTTKAKVPYHNRSISFVLMLTLFSSLINTSEMVFHCYTAGTTALGGINI